MTTKERTQTIELLRCAADIAETDRCEFMMSCGGTAATWLDSSDRVCDLAEAALLAVLDDGSDSASSADEYIAGVLESAARLEEGSLEVAL